MITEIFLPLLMGIAVFLFGLKVMEISLQKWAGPYLPVALRKFTQTPVRGLLTGTFATALLQSSTAITVMTIGFVNAKLLDYRRTLGIILGTNIGTCITTELIGMNITHLSSPLLATAASCFLISCFILFFMSAKGAKYVTWIQATQKISIAVAGFACILLGMQIMQTVGPALQSKPIFAWFLEQSAQSLVWGVIAGAVLTAIIQSGTATIGMAMGLVTVDVMSVELAIAITFGANIGTCSTAFIACIGSSKSAQFVAISHLLLNLGGVLLFFPFISLFSAISSSLTVIPGAQVAHAQTLFNIVSSMIALPFCYLISNPRNPNHGDLPVVPHS